MVTIVEESRQLLASGQGQDELIRVLHEKGLSITESMKILREVGSISLAEAKAAVARHPAWADVVASADRLHDEVTGDSTD